MVHETTLMGRRNDDGVLTHYIIKFEQENGMFYGKLCEGDFGKKVLFKIQMYDLANENVAKIRRILEKKFISYTTMDKMFNRYRGVLSGPIMNSAITHTVKALSIELGVMSKEAEGAKYDSVLDDLNEFLYSKSKIAEYIHDDFTSPHKKRGFFSRVFRRR